MKKSIYINPVFVLVFSLAVGLILFSIDYAVLFANSCWLITILLNTREN